MTYEEEVMQGAKRIEFFELYQEPITQVIERLQEIAQTHPGSTLLIDSETFGFEGTVTVQRGRVSIPLVIK